MKLSTRARYALRMMLDIARSGRDEHPVALSMVAERTDISHGYLEQLAISLRAAGLIRGVPGRGGGYRLARDPLEITLAEIIEASIGPINIVSCVEEPEECLRADLCECRLVYSVINSRITDLLASYSLADLLDQASLHALQRELPHPGSLPLAGKGKPKA